MLFAGFLTNVSSEADSALRLRGVVRIAARRSVVDACSVLIRRDVLNCLELIRHWQIWVLMLARMGFILITVDAEGTAQLGMLAIALPFAMRKSRRQRSRSTCRNLDPVDSSHTDSADVSGYEDAPIDLVLHDPILNASETTTKPIKRPVLTSWRQRPLISSPWQQFWQQRPWPSFRQRACRESACIRQSALFETRSCAFEASLCTMSEH